MSVRLLYLALIVAIVALAAALIETGGRRLPRYYTPNGDIIDLGFTSRAAKIYAINGRDPAVVGPLMGDAPAAHVETDLGPMLMATTPNSAWQFVFDFKLSILFTMIFAAGVVWFLRSAADFHMAALAACLAVFHFSFAFALGYHKLEYVWRLSAAMTPLLVLNAGLRLTGKDIPGRWIIAELIFFSFLALVAYVGGESAQSIGNFEALVLLVFAFAILASLSMLLDNALRRSDDRIERFKRWALFGGFFFGLAMPLLLAQLAISLSWAPWPLEATLALGFVFPAAIAYGTYRLNVIPFQFTLSKSIVAASLTVALTVVYGLFLLLHNLLLPEEEAGYQWLVHGALILVIVFLLDPLQRRLSAFVERNFLSLDSQLSESLKRIAALLSSDSRLQPVALAFLDEVRSILDLEQLSFLAAGPALGGLNVRREAMHRVPVGSALWRYLGPEQMAVTSYLAYGGGRREELFRFLYRNRFMLAIGIVGQRAPDWRTRLMHWLGRGGGAPRLEEQRLSVENYRAALLVGYRVGGRKLALREIRYLQEAARLASQLIYNYALLIQEISKRRRIRALALAGQFQRAQKRLAPDEVLDLRLAYFSRAAISVTGDYFDIITAPDRRLTLFLGDVTGHGVAAGYLASSLRAIARSHVSGGATLVDTVQTMNRFLLERYQGSEFITLFAMALDVGAGVAEYINAAHPAPILVRANGNTEQLFSNQRLIGILPAPYFSNRLKLENGDRLYIYSDGVTETFNSQDEAFGEARLLDFIKLQQKTSVNDTAQRIETALNEFRGGGALTDDLTFVALDYEPRLAPIRGFLAAIGLDRFLPAGRSPR